MKTLFCSKCNQTKLSGVFCPTCGNRLIEKVTVGAKFNRVQTSKTVPTLRNEIVKWLSRVGVPEKDVKIGMDRSIADVEYVLLGKRYNFKSDRQKTLNENLQAIAIFMHHRVLSIERGIESVEGAFGGYAALPGPGMTSSPYDAMSKEELRKLMSMYHPDSNGGKADVVKFQEVKAAYDRK